MSAIQTPLTFELDGLPMGMNGRNGMKRAYWAVYRNARDATTLRIKLSRLELEQSGVAFPIQRCFVIFKIYAARRHDPDNLTTMFKIVGDSLVSAGVLGSDSNSAIRFLLPRELRVPHYNQQKTVVEIMPLSVSDETDYNAEAENWLRTLYATVTMPNTATG